MTSYDIRLKENFKLFISGPSQCGKPFFVADLLQNVQSFAKEPPQAVVYIYTVWQAKSDEMKTLVTYFIEDDENIYDTIIQIASNQPTMVVFDDLINSKTVKTIAKLYMVDGRHMNLSMVFLTQRMFVNNEYFRQVSQNSDYFCVFKNPRNSSEIRTLAQQLTPGGLELVDIYLKATKEPFSYLFINSTQECNNDHKYLSNLFSHDHSNNTNNTGARQGGPSLPVSANARTLNPPPP